MQQVSRTKLLVYNTPPLPAPSNLQIRPSSRKAIRYHKPRHQNLRLQQSQTCQPGDPKKCAVIMNSKPPAVVKRPGFHLPLTTNVSTTTQTTVTVVPAPCTAGSSPRPLFPHATNAKTAKRQTITSKQSSKPRSKDGKNRWRRKEQSKRKEETRNKLGS